MGSNEALLQEISNDEKARMIYDARQAEISDQRTRIKSAVQKRMEKVAEKMLNRGDSREAVTKYQVPNTS